MPRAEMSCLESTHLAPAGSAGTLPRKLSAESCRGHLTQWFWILGTLGTLAASVQVLLATLCRGIGIVTVLPQCGVCWKPPHFGGTSICGVCAMIIEPSLGRGSAD